MNKPDLILPQSVEGKAVAYTLKRWMELNVFMRNPKVELSTNLAGNSMRTIALGRRNWLHLGSKKAGSKIPTHAKDDHLVVEMPPSKQLLDAILFAHHWPSTLQEPL